jgi:hypothetical protein
MKGDKVIVRAFRNKALVRIVWEVASDVVFICSEENYKTLASGKEGLLPVGFPREFVYRYNPNIDLSTQVKWEKLSAYV